MKKIIESKELPTDEKIYLRKGWAGWRVVEPIKDPKTNKFIWRNFLNRKGFVSLIWVILILFFSYMAFQEQLTNYKNVLENPCDYCFMKQEAFLNGINLTENSVSFSGGDTNGTKNKWASDGWASVSNTS